MIALPATVTPAKDPYKGYVDSAFDSAFEELSLPWLPWVGCNFRESARRTIVLGESIYLYGTSEAPETARARIEDPASLRLRHLSHGIEANHDTRFVRNFERAVFQKKRPNRGDRERLWGEVIYHNLAPALLEKVAHRPSDEHYRAGWKIMLQLAEVVGATRCIVYGHEARKIEALLTVLPEGQLIEAKRLPVVGKKAVPKAVTIGLAGRQLNLLFIGHPSRYFSWRQWGRLLQERDMRPAHG